MTDRAALLRCMVIGDIIGKPGRLAVVGSLRDLRAELDLDLVIANGENLAAGAGLTPSLAEELLGQRGRRHHQRQPHLGQARDLRLPRQRPPGAAPAELSR